MGEQRHEIEMRAAFSTEIEVLLSAGHADMAEITVRTVNRDDKTIGPTPFKRRIPNLLFGAAHRPCFVGLHPGEWRDAPAGVRQHGAATAKVPLVAEPRPVFRPVTKQAPRSWTVRSWQNCSARGGCVALVGDRPVKNIPRPVERRAPHPAVNSLVGCTTLDGAGD